MLRIGICDDESHGRDSLRLSVEHILKETEGEIVYEFSSGKSVVNWISNHRGEIDLLFLDIEMDGISGMEAARRIRKQDSEILLVFVTGYTDYVFDGYSVQALDYLVKPVLENKLEQVLRRAQEIMRKTEPQSFTLKNSEGLYRIAKKDILYFYSDRRFVTLVTKDRAYPFYGKLDEVEKQLNPEFVRIHQRYLVRTEAVQIIENNSITIGEVSLPISRSLHQKAMLALANSLLGEGSL